MEKNYEPVLRLFRTWLEKTETESELHQELKVLESKLGTQAHQEALDEIYEAFYRELDFGTGGLRGILGAGTNRMNVYTVGKATQGLADYLLAHHPSNPSIAISYDTRNKSEIFAEVAAEVMSANGITVYLYSEPSPTPMLSYAVRYFKASAGIMVTASHNPAIYNGYKVYNDEGCQMTIEAADEVLGHIERTDTFHGVKRLAKGAASLQEAGQSPASPAPIHIIEKSVEDAYMKEVLKAGVPTDCSNLEVVYTPLNGTGLKPVMRILGEIGVGKVHMIKDQELPDGNFTTCPYPNPEKKEALHKGLELCGVLQTPDLLMATDPDCDRIGIAVLTDGGNTNEYKLLTGNEVGALLLDFLCKEKKRPENAVVIKTIVTSNMAKDICAAYNVEMREVLTGFKFIGEIIGQLEREGREDRFFFGFEESYGYLSGPYVRDKDAVDAAMLICQMAAFYKSQSMTLWDRLIQLYDHYGYYVDAIKEFAFEGAAGMQAMARIMEALRKKAPGTFAESPVVSRTDYMNDQTSLPRSEVLRYTMKNGAGLIARPSGTEPKLKIYLSAKEASRQSSLDVIEKMKKEISAFVETYR